MHIRGRSPEPSEFSADSPFDYSSPVFSSMSPSATESEPTTSVQDDIVSTFDSMSIDEVEGWIQEGEEFLSSLPSGPSGETSSNSPGPFLDALELSKSP